MPGSSGLPGPAGVGRGTQSAASLAAANALPTGARQASNVAAAAAPVRGRGAPPLASAAPSGTTKYNYIGLVDAMNAYEQELVTAGTVRYPNVYEVKFVPESLAASKLALPGGTDYSKTPDQQAQTAKAKLDPSTNSMNTQGKNIAVSQGTQIIQFIEMTVRNSRYITDQLKVIQDQVSGNSQASTSTSSNNTTTWFKVLVNAVPIGDKVDDLRHDFPYRITYTVTQYAINEAQSQYFPQAQFRGVQKLYNYWFTGENTQVLSYEQSYNAQYINVLSSKTKTEGAQGVTNSALADSVGYGIGPNKNVPSPRSGQSDQQAQNGANNPASTLADYLYSFADQGEITLSIIGDPAWLIQGEVAGLAASAVQFTGFYPDGSINTDNQQAVFAVNWNAPADYNNGPSGPYSGSGLMDVNASATNGNNNNLSTTPTQASAAYMATQITSKFSKGKFEQELKGTALKNLNQKQIAEASRPAAKTTVAPAVSVQPTGRVSLLQQAESAVSDLVSKLNPFSRNNATSSPATQNNSATPISNLPTQGADQPGPPTSEGVVVGNAKPNPISPPVITQPVSNADIAAIKSVQENLKQPGGQQTAEQAASAVARYNTQTQTMAAKDA